MVDASDLDINFEPDLTASTSYFPLFRTAYDGFADDISLINSLQCPEPTLAQQQFADECDINTIVNKFLKTGELTADVHLPKYGDFTGISDYQSALNAVIAADEAFLDLPANIRAEFGNDPQMLLEFLADSKNAERAAELGLIDWKEVLSPASSERSIAGAEEVVGKSDDSAPVAPSKKGGKGGV